MIGIGGERLVLEGEGMLGWLWLVIGRFGLVRGGG